MPVLLRQAAKSGHQTPYRNAPGNQAATALGVGDPAQRNPGDGVKNRERQPHQQAHLGVTDLQVAANRLNQQVQNLSIYKGQNIGNQQNTDSQPGPFGRRIAIILVHAMLHFL